jgi:protein SCO1/2
MTRRAAWLAALALFGLPLLAFGFLSLRVPAAPPLENDGEVPDFQLTDQEGRPLTRENLKGMVWAADFMFTQCPGPCPMMTAKLRRVHSRLAGEGNFRLVSFTVDPENDTPAVLKKYAERHEIEGSRWFFLTGPKTSLDALSVSGFHLGSEGLAHSTKVVLVDDQAHIRGYYDGLDDKQMDVLGDDALRLLRQTTLSR